MTREQFILLKLAEECAEVSQRAIKQIQFGTKQIQTGTEVKGGTAAPAKEAGLTNGERLKKELLDLFIMVKLLEEANEIPVLSGEEFDEARIVKIEKLNKYIAFSRQLGQLDGEWTI